MQSLSEERDYKECHGLPFFTLIDAKGNVLPCNLFYGSPNLTYGNLYKNSFSEIWKSKRRKEVLKKLKEKGVAECRGACRLNPINQYLFQLKNPHPHQNFI
jgi:radical SAM protein with 4Fe4S-binding SPASM domain